MASGAIKVELTNSTGNPRRYAVASGVAIAKGTLLKLIDVAGIRTASAAVTLECPCAGIAAMDKSATNDDSTSISVWTDGIFEMIASGAIAVGNQVMSAGGVLNQVIAASAAASGAKVLGYALETAADTEWINVRVRL